MYVEIIDLTADEETPRKRKHPIPPQKSGQFYDRYEGVMVIFKVVISDKEHTLVGKVVCANANGAYCVSCPNYCHSAEIYQEKAVVFDLSINEVIQGSELYIAAGPSSDTDFQKGEQILVRFPMGHLYAKNDPYRSMQVEQYYMYQENGEQNKRGFYPAKLLANKCSKILVDLSVERYLIGDWLPNFYCSEEFSKWVINSSDGGVMQCPISQDYDYEKSPFKSPFKSSRHSSSSSSRYSSSSSSKHSNSSSSSSKHSNSSSSSSSSKINSNKSSSSRHSSSSSSSSRH
jgi:hypothetical protein